MLIVLVLILVTGSILLSFPSVQSWAVDKVASSLSESLETEVTVGAVDVSWSGKMELNDVLVKDRKNDSLFFIHQINLRVLSFDRTDQKAIVGKTTLLEPLVNFRQRVDEDEMNFQFIVDLAKPTGGAGGVWNIFFKNLEIVNGTFRYKMDGHEAPTDRSFDENDFAFNRINAELKDFYLIGDSLDFKMKKFSTVEKHGLELKRFVCKSKDSLPRDGISRNAAQNGEFVH